MKLFGFTIGAAVVSTSTGANLYETANSAGLTTLAYAVKLAGLDGAVGSTNPLTVFAPTNAAFSTISSVVSYLTVNSTYSNELLGRVLKTHVVSGNITASQVPTVASQIKTLGQNITAVRNGTSVTVSTPKSSAKVVNADVFASNGVAHVIDSVLVPDALPLKNIVKTALDTPILSVLVSALLKEGTLINTANSTVANKALTVFAPTDDAFKSLLAALKLASLNDVPAPLLANVLKAHIIVDSDVVRASSASGLKATLAGLIDLTEQLKANTTNVETLNGVVHIVNKVILPTLASFLTRADQADLSTLVTLVVGAGLLPAVSGAFGDLTVFAPTDAAFLKVPAKVRGHLTNPIDFNKKQLENVLKYHIVSGVVNSNQLGASQSTLSGEKLTFLGASINGNVNITAVDLNKDGLGGLVHKIDGVLVPKTLSLKTITELAVGNTFLSTLVTALSVAKLVDTFDLPSSNAWTVFAPTDAAFSEVQGVVEAALKNETLLKTILFAHVVPSVVLSTELPAEITTLGGEKILSSSLKVNTADINAINGVVHVLDKVIIPPSLATAPTTSAPTTGAPSTKAPSKSNGAGFLSAAVSFSLVFVAALMF